MIGQEASADNPKSACTGLCLLKYIAAMSESEVRLRSATSRFDRCKNPQADYLSLRSHFVRNAATIVIMKKLSFPRSLAIVPSMFLAGALAPATVNAQNAPAGDAAKGKAFFEIACAVCHSP